MKTGMSIIQELESILKEVAELEAEIAALTKSIEDDRRTIVLSKKQLADVVAVMARINKATAEGVPAELMRKEKDKALLSWRFKKLEFEDKIIFAEQRLKENEPDRNRLQNKAVKLRHRILPLQTQARKVASILECAVEEKRHASQKGS